MNSTEKVIVEKAKAGYPCLYLLTSELMRSLADVRAASQTLKREFYVWTLGKGLQKSEYSAGEKKWIYKEPTDVSDSPEGVLTAIRAIGEGNRNWPGGIFVLKLMHHYLERPLVQTLLLDLIGHSKTAGKTIVILTPVKKIPTELEKDIAFVEVTLPSKEDLGNVLDSLVRSNNVTPPEPEMRRLLIEAAMGLTTSEAENAFSLSLVRSRMEEPNQPARWIPDVVLAEKCQTLKKTDLLTFYPSTHQGMNSVGGMRNLKEWVAKRRSGFTQEAATFGCRAPKGIFTVGPPGTGKSVSARAIADEYGLPLLRCDMGKIFAGIVGASEANVRLVIQTATALAPCVLWLDEIEKGLAGSSGSGSTDSGVGARVLGTFLTWMQEQDSGVFVYATANNIVDPTGRPLLPPELLRKGRFNEIFSVDLPNRDERGEIFAIHLRRKKRGDLIGKTINLEELIGLSEGYSGSEIEEAIEDATFTAFNDGQREITTLDIRLALDETVPLSKLMAQQLAHIRAFCKDRTRPANAPVVTQEIQVGLGGRRVDLGGSGGAQA